MDLFRRMKQKFALERRKIMCALAQNKLVIYFSYSS